MAQVSDRTLTGVDFRSKSWPTMNRSNIKPSCVALCSLSTHKNKKKTAEALWLNVTRQRKQDIWRLSSVVLLNKLPCTQPSITDRTDVAPLCSNSVSTEYNGWGFWSVEIRPADWLSRNRLGRSLCEGDAGDLISETALNQQHTFVFRLYLVLSFRIGFGDPRPKYVG